MKAALSAFRDNFEPDQVVTDPAILQTYGKDWLKVYSANPTAVLFPKTTEDVSRMVKIAVARGIALVPSGGRTGLSGGATATNKEFVLSCEKLTGVLEVNSTDCTLRCSAGIITQKVQEAAAAAGLYFPVDFSSAGSSQIGGNIATNAGGIRVIKYGCIRNHVLGLKVVTGSGEILDLNGPLYKNQSGYNLHSIFIGSEGTLGIITEATLALSPPPGPLLRVLCGINDRNQILPLLHRLRPVFPELSVFEFFPRSGLDLVMKHHQVKDPFDEPYNYYLLVEFEAASDSLRERAEEFFYNALENENLNSAILSHSQKQLNEFMQLRELLPETLSSHYVVHKNDISVPIPDIPEFMAELETTITREYPSFSVVIFGHIGDGNLHINVIKPDEMRVDAFKDRCKDTDSRVLSLVSQFKGSISAEHGVGLLKKQFLHLSRSETEIKLMKELKQVFDPAGILNPGKIWD